MGKKKLLDLEGLQYYHRKLKAVIGELSALTTSAKDNLVVAINEAEADALEAGRMATSAQTTANEALAKAEASGHTHNNKALLDTYRQTEVDLADAVAKKHAHSNATVLDGITAEKVAGWDQAVTDDHTHSNKAILDATTASYTTEEKTKLAGIAEGAQVNKIETVKVNGTALTPDASKAVDVTVPTKLTDLTNDGNFVQDASYVHTDNNYTSAEKTKLAGIAENAQVNVLEGVQVNGADLTIDANKKVNVVIPAAAVDGVKSGEKIIGLDGTKLTSTLSVAIEKKTIGQAETDCIVLKGIGGEEVAYVDASAFVKDGMIDTVAWGTGAKENVLIITWNTDAGKVATEIDFAKFIDDYTAGNGIDVTGKVISVKLDPTQGNVTLSTTSAGLKAEVDLSGKADKVASATSGNFAGLDANGNLTDSGKKAADFADAVHTHAISDVTGLQDALNGKVATTTTIAGVDLADNITKAELLQALNVADGAQANVIEGVTLNGTDASISGKKAQLSAITSVAGGTYVENSGTFPAAALDIKSSMIQDGDAQTTGHDKLATKGYVDDQIAGIAAPSDAQISFVDNGNNALGSFTLNQASPATIDIFDSISNAEIDALFV